MQDKKKAEADRQKELNDLFAIAIKQPKVPPGASCCTAMWSFGAVALPCPALPALFLPVLPCLVASESHRLHLPLTSNSATIYIRTLYP